MICKLKPLILFTVSVIFFSVTCCAQLPGYVPSSGLLLYYGFNSNANDLSGQGVTGTVSGATYATDRFSNPNSALHFSGTAERVTTHKIDRSTVNSFSYSVWVNTSYTATIPYLGSASGLSTSQSYSCIIAPVDGVNWATGSTHVGAGLNVATNGVYVVEHGNAITNVVLSWTGTLSGWHHIVIVYSSKQPSLYIDGSYVTTGLTSTYTVHPSMGCDSFVTGSSYPYLTAGFGHGLFPISVPNYNFSGYLDDIAIYNRVLMPCEITQLYDTISSISAITGTATLSPCDTTTLYSASAGGLWTSGNASVATIGSSSGFVTAMSAGTTTITYTTGTGCSVYRVVTVNPLPAITGSPSVCIGASTSLSNTIAGGIWSTSFSIASVGSTSGIATGLSAGIAIITYTIPAGCNVLATLSINPVPPTPYGANHVCVGSNTTLTDSIPGGIWLSSGGFAAIGSSSGLVSGISSGTATITYTSPLGCTITMPFTVNPNPASITGTLNVCIGSTTTLSDASPGGTWSCSNLSLATVGSGTGIVSGIATGLPHITYTLPTGCFYQTPVTVNPLPGPISGITTLCVGNSVTLTDAGTGTWSSSNTSVAIVGATTGVVTGISAGTATITYTRSIGCRITTTVTINPVPAPITGVNMLCLGQSTTLADTSSGGVWYSSNTAIATVGTSTGIVNSTGTGIVTISYSYSTGCMSSFVITVNPLPSVITGGYVVCEGATSYLYDAGSGTWTSSNTSVATIGSVSGLLAGIASGVATITYTLPTGCKTTASITVNSLPVPISGTANLCAGGNVTLTDATAGGVWLSSTLSVATVGSGSGYVNGISAGNSTISYVLPSGCFSSVIATVNPLPAVISGVSSLCIGQTATFIDPGGGIWTSANPTIASIGSVSGLVTAVSSGITSITYTLSTGCSISSVITVNSLPAPISGLPHVCSGSTVLLSDIIIGGTWSSSDYSTAYIDPGTGLLTGMSTGSATITYTTLGGCWITMNVTVDPLPGSIGGTPVVCAGGTTNLVDAGGGTWSSGAPLLATVNMITGVVTGVASGTAVISYTLPSGCSATIPLLINPIPLPVSGAAGICMGLTDLLSDATYGGSWSSSNTAIASVGISTGLVTATGIGTAIISYTLPTGCFSTLSVTTNSSPGPILGNIPVCVGSTITLSNTLPGGTWSMASTTVATIGSSTGIVSGIGVGTAIVTYSLGAGCSTMATITVNPMPGAIVGTPVVCSGSVIVLTDPAPGGTWGSSNSLIAMAGSSSGIISGVATGTATISYLLSPGCYRTVVVTVNPLPSPISGPSSVCPGSMISLSDLTPGGIWNSSNISVATVSLTGVVTGIIPGVVNIYYTSTLGCIRQLSVTVNPLPPAISGPSVVCAGSSVTLTNSVPGIWSTVGGYATIGATTGIVNGITAGTAVISFVSSSGCIATKSITVNPLPLPITGPLALCAGATITLTDPGSGSWGSSNIAVATIGSATGIVAGVTSGTTNITYTLPSGCTTTAIVTVTPAPSAISGALSLCAGSTTPLSDFIPGGLWSSSNIAVGSIGSLTGIVTGVTSGSVTITYSLGSGCTVYRSETIIAAPAPVSGSTGVCIGSSSVFTDVTTGGTWSCTPGTIASVSGTGIVTGIAAGVASVSYTVAGCSAVKFVTVNSSPVPISGLTSVCVGASVTESESVTGGTWSTSSANLSVGSGTGIVIGISSGIGIITYSIGSCYAARAITVNPVPVVSGATGLCMGTTNTLSGSISGGAWASSLTSVATVSALSGLVSGIAPGNATIFYTLPTGCSANVIVTVTTAPGAITGTTHVCTGATDSLSNGTGGGIWSITPLTTASIGSSSGIVTGILPGNATVTYSLGSGCNATVIVTVNASPAAITGITHVCPGLTTLLNDATPGGTWSSGTPSIASIIPGSGLITGNAAGIDIIDYTLPTGCFSSVTVTVNPLPASITGMPALCSGLTGALSDVTSGGSWSSTVTTVATIGSGSGFVTGLLSGTTSIVYTLPTGCFVTRILSVTPSPAPVSGGTGLCVGSSIALSDPTPGGVWSSGAVSIAAVSTSGVVSGISYGTTSISYTIAGCPAIKSVTVNTMPSIILGPDQVCAGSSGTFSDMSPGGVWSSSNAMIASIGTGTGIVTGIVAGTATLSYSLGAGCTVWKPVTVSAIPPAITGTMHVCVGGTTVVSDPLAGGIWSSSNPAMATISTTGLVTGIAGGITILSYTSSNGCSATSSMTVISVPLISGVHNLCAWGDTMIVSDVNTTGVFSSSFATVTNVGPGMGRVLGNAPGSATVTYTLPSGCSATSAFIVNPLPNTISGSDHICSGNTLTLTDVSPGGVWTSGNTSVATVGSSTGLVTGVATGTAPISYTFMATGCKVDTPVMVSSTPATITGPASVFIGAPITLADAVSGGYWSSSNTAVASVGITSGHVTGVSVGSVTISYTTGGLCSATRHINVMPMASGHSGTLSIDGFESGGGNEIHVLPNPGNGAFTLDLFWDTRESIQIVITNAAGIKVKEFKAVANELPKSSIAFNLDEPHGVYILTATGKASQASVKFVIIH